MSEDIVKLRFHHKGKFQETGYVGGEESVIIANPELLSLPILMEFVRDDLKYTEIGGVYRRNVENGDWEMFKTDAELCKVVDRAGNGGHLDWYIDNVVDKKIEPLKTQPHVLVRPRPILFVGVPKRMYVTTHKLQQKRNKIPVVVCSPRMSPRLNKQQVKNLQASDSTMKQSEAPVNLSSANVKRRLDICDPPAEDETTDENLIQEMDLPPPPSMTVLDKMHATNINNLTEYERKKILNVMQNNEVFMKHNLPALATGFRETLKKIKVKEMVQERDAITQEECCDQDYIPEHEEQSEDETLEKPKKKIKKAEKKQPRAGPRTRSQVNDLTTTNKDAPDKEAKEAVLTEPTPPCTIQLPSLQGPGTMLAYNSMRKRQREDNKNGDKAPIRPRGKTRMDKVHTRSVDKQVVIRMNHKFQPVAADDRIRAELGSVLGTLRRCVSLTYKNWAHVPATLKKTLWDYVKPIPTDAAVFVENRKRKVGRKYKSNTAVMNYRLGKIEKALTGEDESSNVEDLVTDGKSHGPSWLVGRVEFEAKVKEDVAAEVKKNVQEEVDSKLVWNLKKLSEANPTFVDAVLVLLEYDSFVVLSLSFVALDYTYLVNSSNNAPVSGRLFRVMSAYDDKDHLKNYGIEYSKSFTIHHLEVVTFSDFKGQKSESELVKFLLGHKESRSEGVRGTECWFQRSCRLRCHKNSKDFPTLSDSSVKSNVKFQVPLIDLHGVEGVQRKLKWSKSDKHGKNGDSFKT
ncbi:hypothetical protein AgCh_034733 [Apium graveolens]